MEILIYLFIIVYAILSIILFFKIWNMTDNVAKLTDYIINIKKNEKYINNLSNEVKNKECVEYDKRLDTLIKGDKVKSKEYGIVTVVKNNKLTIECNCGFLNGYNQLDKNSLIYIE